MNHPKISTESLIPENEMERLMALSELDLDFMDLENSLSDLTKLAAKIAGTKVSLVNLIDHFTQWSVSSFGMDVSQMPREESICQYTILDPKKSEFEVKDLSADERFNDRPFVIGHPNLRYYYGIPLKVNDEISLGALCVLDTDYKQLIGLAEIIQSQGNQNKLEEVLEFINLIQKSGKSLLELADEILSQDYGLRKDKELRKPTDAEFTLNSLKAKMVNMFEPQALVKNIDLEVQVESPNAEVPFPKNKILQILGNLVSNSIKFTPQGGEIKVL